MDATVVATGSSSLAGLVPQVAGRSSSIMALGLAGGTVVSFANGVPLSLSLASGQYAENGGMGSFAVGLSWVSLTSVMSGEAVESAGGVHVSLSLASGKAFPKPSKTSCSLKVIIFLCATLALLHSSPKGKVHWVPVGWLPPPSIDMPAYRPGSSTGASAGHLGRMGHCRETYPS